LIVATYMDYYSDSERVARDGDTLKMCREIEG
jgi:hypothetical protein